MDTEPMDTEVADEDDDSFFITLEIAGGELTGETYSLIVSQILSSSVWHL